jgi:diaminopimelate epimerase
VRFAKGHGTGNDFVLLPDAEDTLELTPARVRALCDRHTGIGADGVLRVVRAGERWLMDYRNADGSLAEMCGNGVRVYARWLVDAGWARPGRVELLTRAGVRAVDVPEQGDVTVDMGAPRVGEPPAEVWLGTVRSVGTPVSMGNPHVVVEVPDVAGVAWDGVPEDVNVEVVQRTGPHGLRMRVHERGVGETLSCGTGACAAVVAAAGWAGQAPPVSYEVELPGGRLEVAWTGETVLLTGPAVIVASGETVL